MAGYLRALLAELLGTFAWVALAAGAVCADHAAEGRLGPGGIALAQGLGVAAVFGLFGRQSSALFNPAIALGLAALRRLDAVRAALSVLCQLLGAALAGLFLSVVFGHAGAASETPYLGAVLPAAVGFRGATLVEAVLTFFLSVACFKFLYAQDRRFDAAGTAVLAGAFCAAAWLLAGPLSGAAMNPARAFGPAVASGLWSQHYVYWIGPVAGAVAGLKLSEFLFEK